MRAQEFYTKRIQELSIELIQVQKRFQLYTFLRLLFFLLAGNAVFFLFGTLAVFPVFTVFIFLFLYVVHLSVDAKYKRDKVVALIEVNKNELEVLKGNWSFFEDGSEFKNAKHPFSLDMDLFGKKSVFQLLNRTTSCQGKLKLSETLTKGSDKIEIDAEAISELSENLTWCQEFISEGIVRKKEEEKEVSLKPLSSLDFVIDTEIKLLRVIIPIIAVSATVMVSSGLITDLTFGVVLIGIQLLLGRKMKKVNSVAQILTIQSNRVKTILKQLELYKSMKAKASLFKKQQDELLDPENGVLKEMMELDLIMNRFDYRINLLVRITLNFFLAWDFLILVQFKKWLDKNGGKVENWEDKMAELEVWISGAVFKFNYPQSTFAVMKEDAVCIEIVGLSHPFVVQDKTVLNDVELKGEENFIIITGPNMAGKSTYLRSLGLTFVLANAGFPVLASSCKLPKLKLFSSMRTSDDLTEESSYFHAELTRLRLIMDAIEQGEKVFIILDEILKGTNSKDKEIGSAKFLQKLKRLNSKGIIATHDLSLCDLATDNNAFKNMCFDSIIDGDSLTFDYKINYGICKNMNASFLLKQMNLVD